LRARYGALLALTGDIPESRLQFQRLGVGDSAMAQGFVLDALRADAHADTSRLRRDLLAASAWAPFDERMVIPLVRLEIRDGALDDATARLQQARRHGLDPILYEAHMAWIAAVRGDRVAATRWLGQIPTAAVENDPRVAATLVLARESMLAQR
jgi:ATP/maltotriose-dependent transcriptional regulator MalT